MDPRRRLRSKEREPRCKGATCARPSSPSRGASPRSRRRGWPRSMATGRDSDSRCWQSRAWRWRHSCSRSWGRTERSRSVPDWGVRDLERTSSPGSPGSGIGLRRPRRATASRPNPNGPRGRRRRPQAIRTATARPTAAAHRAGSHPRAELGRARPDPGRLRHRPRPRRQPPLPRRPPLRRRPRLPHRPRLRHPRLRPRRRPLRRRSSRSTRMATGCRTSQSDQARTTARSSRIRCRGTLTGTGWGTPATLTTTTTGSPTSSTRPRSRNRHPDERGGRCASVPRVTPVAPIQLRCRSQADNETAPTEELPHPAPVPDPVRSPALDPVLTPAPGTLPPPGRVVGRVSSRALPPVSGPVTFRVAPPLAPKSP